MTLDQGGSAMDQDMNRGDYSDPKVITALDRFVGAIARNYTIPEFESDDGISNQREGGLKLVLSYAKQEDNSCRLNASIK